MSKSRSSLLKNKHNALFNIALYIVKLIQKDEVHIDLRPLSYYSFSMGVFQNTVEHLGVKDGSVRVQNWSPKKYFYDT